MKLIELAEACDVAGVVRELGTLTPDQRAALAAAVDARRDTMRADWLQRTVEARTAQFAAELGCRVSPESAAAWLLDPENGGVREDFSLEGAWTVDVLNLHPAEWRAGLAAQLIEQGTGRRHGRFPLIEHLIRDTGCPVPTSDEFINCWLSHRGYLYSSRNVLERLRVDDFTPQLLPLALARPGVRVRELHQTLVSLAAEGVIDRDALIRGFFAEMIIDPPRGTGIGYLLAELDLTPAEHASVAGDRATLVERLLADLLRDGTRIDTARPIAFLRALASTPAENALTVRDHVALLDGSLPVADYAQGVLTELDEAGLLEAEVLTEVCERVLLRPEKKLVRAQLRWLDTVAKRNPERAGLVLADVSIAFGQKDLALQEEALKVVARHLKTAGESVLPELRTASAQLSPGLAARAAEVLGMRRRGAGEQFADVLPVVSESRPVPGPIATAAEAAQEVAAVVAGDQDVAAFERALDGLVRHARLDRTALARALKPVVRREPRKRSDIVQADLYDVARAARGDEPREGAVHTRRDPHPYHFSLPGTMLAARLTEAMEVIESGAQPFLLAVPTLATGALDAAVLVERISALDELGVTPAPVDLAQALLRVTPTQDEKVLRTAGDLGSDAGQRLARWLREGGLPHQESEPEVWPRPKPQQVWWELCTPERHRLLLDTAFPSPAAALVGPYEGRTLMEPPAPFWVAQLPHHRDEVMARYYFEGRNFSVGQTRALPFVAESGGPAGFAVHLALAFGMAHGRPAEHDPAVEAVLVLAARGQLDSGLLGRQLEVLLRGRAIMNPVCDSLRAAAETGAYATVWSVLEVALPGLLRDTPVQGAAALLALAVECASRCGASTEIAEVTAVARRTGSSLVVKNARLLRDVLR
ncbi:MAG: hypothetical protein JWM19_6509 [Actinomycetia bacterium]|nr:hypothetical protein [Actinomycetes bacterium]